MVTETPEQAEARLLKVIGAAQLVVLEAPYAYQPLSADQRPSSVAVACVRDGDIWFQLAPAVQGAALSEPQYRVFSFHFAESPNASGFVGWLASHLKRTVGTASMLTDSRIHPYMKSTISDGSL